MLRATTIRAGAALPEHLALNDVVITKAARARMTDLSVSVGDEFVTRVKADGLIVATPTGSTAYNLAAGGPIVQPVVDAIVLTPIAPHMLTNRPIVIPASSLVRVQPMMAERDELYVTFDGQAGYQLEAGDEVRIRCAERRVRLLRPSSRSYFEVLRQKLKWNERYPLTSPPPPPPPPLGRIRRAIGAGRDGEERVLDALDRLPGERHRTPFSVSEVSVPAATLAGSIACRPVASVPLEPRPRR